MARFHEEEDDDAPKVRKRRRPIKKPVEDDEDTPKSKQNQQEDDEEGENSLSTGYVLLDILLDFRDDCIEWAEIHFVAAVGIAILVLLLTLTALGLTIRYIVNYINRPTLALAVQVLDLGAYAEAKLYAKSVLKYASPESDFEKSGALFVLGAATIATADIAWDSDRKPYYLAAAGYLRDSEKYGFIASRRDEGYFLLGKSLYLAGELPQCREPLKMALELNAPESKMIYWYLANSYFLGIDADFSEAMRYLRMFQKSATLTEEERYESYLLQSLILIKLGDTENAEIVFKRVPRFNRFRGMENFISGLLAMQRGTKLRLEASELANRPTPPAFDELPMALPPVLPIETEIPNETSLGNKVDSKDERQDITEPNLNSPPIPVTSPPSEWDLPPGPVLPESAVYPIIPVQPTVDTAVDPWGIPIVASSAGPIARRFTALRSDARRFSGDSMSNNSTLTDTKADATVDATADTPSNTPEPKGTVPKAGDGIIILEPESEPPAPLPSILPNIKKHVDISPLAQRVKQMNESADAEFQQAIEFFSTTRLEEAFTPRWLRSAMLLEGLCYKELSEFSKAQEVFLDVIDTFPNTAEAAAANFFWAELERTQGLSALSGYARAFEIMRKDPNYSLFWLTKEKIIDRIGEITQEDITLKDYNDAVTILNLAVGVAPMKDISQLRGETFEDWGTTLNNQAKMIFGERGDDLEKDAQSKFVKAGIAFDEFATFCIGTPEYADYLWRSAANFNRGNDFRRAIIVYRKFIAANQQDKRPEVFLNIGEMYLQLDGIIEAIDVLQNALKDYPNHALVPRIRLLLSRAYIENKEWEKARELLQLNLLGEYSPASPVYRDSIYALAQWYFMRGNFSEAIPCFENALQRHPDAIQAADAHYALAQMMLKNADDTENSSQEATLPEIKRKIIADAQIIREKALTNFNDTQSILLNRRDAIGLTNAEKLMLRNAIFAIGSLLMKLERYQEAIQVLNRAATQYQNSPEVMDALISLAIAFRSLGRIDDALSTLNRAEVVLKELEKSGTLPPQNNWNGLIQTKRNIILFNEQENTP